MLVGLGLLTGCSDEPRVIVADDVPDAHVEEDAGTSSPNTFATATAQLDPVAHAAGSEVPVQGTATWRATRNGVDLEVSFFGCAGLAPYPVEIIDAGDCSEASLQAATWKGGRGEGIPGVVCTGVASGMGRLTYGRSDDRDDGWTIGGPKRSDLLGHALLIRDAVTMAPRACGVITRGDDLVRVPSPPLDQPPSVELRAQLTGTCLLKQLVGAVPDCPNPNDLVACASDHCDLGGCIATCAEYTTCLAGKEDSCQSMFECSQSPDCARCQGEMWTCVLGYCSEDISCVPSISPDGPCRKIEACCALQGEKAASCLSVVQLIENLGGDASCIGAMNDWDVLSHMHVPCAFMEQAQ